MAVYLHNSPNTGAWFSPCLSYWLVDCFTSKGSSDWEHYKTYKFACDSEWDAVETAHDIYDRHFIKCPTIKNGVEIVYFIHDRTSRYYHLTNFVKLQDENEFNECGYPFLADYAQTAISNYNQERIDRKFKP